jgi:hypothetical protein
VRRTPGLSRSRIVDQAPVKERDRYRTPRAVLEEFWRHFDAAAAAMIRVYYRCHSMARKPVAAKTSPPTDLGLTRDHPGLAGGSPIGWPKRCQLPSSRVVCQTR